MFHLDPILILGRVIALSPFHVVKYMVIRSVSLLSCLMCILCTALKISFDNYLSKTLTDIVLTLQLSPSLPPFNVTAFGFQQLAISWLAAFNNFGEFLNSNLFLFSFFARKKLKARVDIFAL